MKKKYVRVGFTQAQKAELWERWRRGEQMKSIGREFGKPSSSIFKHIRSTGGFTPVVRRRASAALSLAEREEVSRGLVEGQSIRSIARDLKRAASTISREVARNGGIHRYRAVKADKRAWKLALWPKPCKLVLQASLRQAVVLKLETHWSPQQIAGWLKRTYPDRKDMHISHETIYKSLYVQARGALKKELVQYLRSKRQLRGSRHAKKDMDRRGKIPDAISISERPASVEGRAVPGHWEGDLICGPNHSFIATLVERHSRYVMLAKLSDRKTDTVVNALIKQSRKLPDELYKSLTWDRGHELAAHKRFTLETNIDVYFCDPQSPWQRGTNENTNRLLRQYFPKGTNLSIHSQAELDAVARELNERPRKTLEYETPAERFSQCVAATR
jgi:IS30 family transposase